MAQVINLNPSEEFHISRGFNASTGYQWFHTKSDGLNVDLSQGQACSSPGCGSMIHWKLSADKIGTYLFSISNMRPWENEIPTVENYIIKVSKSDITLYIENKSVVGYKYKNRILTPDGSPLPNNLVVIEFVVSNNINGYLKFYILGDKYVYVHYPLGSDMMNTLYSQDGKKLGIPSGGLTGKGDGKTSMKGAKHLFDLTLK